MSETFAMTLERLIQEAKAMSVRARQDGDTQQERYYEGVRDAYRHAYRMETGSELIHRGLLP